MLNLVDSHGRKIIFGDVFSYIKKCFSSAALLCVIFLIFPAIISAQEEVSPTSAPESKIEVQINSVDTVGVGRKLILDARDSVPESKLDAYIFKWNFGDGLSEFGPEVAHNFTKPGLYDVSLTVSGEEQEVPLTKQIFVYNNNVLLVSDSSVRDEMVDGFMQSAREQNTFINHFRSDGGVGEFLIEEELLARLAEGQQQIKDADIIMFWTEGSLGATLLSALRNTLPSAVIDFSNKTVIFVTNGSLRGLKSLAQGTFDNIKPKYIVITYPESRYPLLESLNLSVEGRLSFTEILSARGVSYEFIDTKTQFKVHRFMSYFINYMINNGVPSNTIKLVLILSVIVTVISFMKQVIGFDTLGVYTPSMLAISFVALDIWFGLIILMAILSVSLLARKFMKNYTLMYIPRMSIVTIVISLLILLLLVLTTYFNVSSVIAISIFPMFLLINVAERCVSLVGEKGMKVASEVMFEVLIVSVIAYFVADSAYVRTMMLAYPELVILLIFVNFFLGRWKGLRVVEYVRFREVFKNYAEEE